MNDLKMDEQFEDRFFDDHDKYFTVIAFFMWILERAKNFKERIHDFSKEIGFGNEVLGCIFPTIFESPDEEGYFEEGVEFYGIVGNDEDEIVIDYVMFLKCVELAYSIYSEKYGRDEEIEKDIEYMHEKYWA